ncbi:hypothetical protein SAMN05444143_102179 [Flavobacterium succinicans]|uniref:Uncharacterized protein n=1 Tax=Flavobacterium succinicans TaxID=29536 RepID=A0A1I4TLU9_9FLAO|nr:hypothetical protein [Flavobacterium succinicans]SFM77722.1 hypothetical protein SAMN05444143_102179 [Flavobacterium succinicans]
MLLNSPDSSGNPFWAGVQHKKIAADSGTMLPDKALLLLLLEKKVMMIVIV